MTLIPLSHAARLSLVTAAACLIPCGAQTVAPFYATEYSLRDLGAVPGLLLSAGALVFKNDNPDRLVARFDDKFMTVTVQRNAEKRITGFSAPTVLSDAEGYISSLAYGPNGVLFFSNASRAAIGEVRPGDTGISRYVDGNTLIFNDAALGNIDGLAFVPAGFAGAGRLKILSNHSWYDTSVSPDGNGTYDIENPVSIVSLPSVLEAAVYVPAGQAKFANASILATDSSGARVVSFEVNTSGDPIAATAKDVVTGFTQAMGLARDPVTGDFLMTSFGGGPIYLLARLAAAPPTVALTSPANNSAFGTKDQINLVATASVPAGSSGSLVVEFFDGATLIGTSREVPFQASVVIPTPGVHPLTAVATANGLSTTSSIVSVTITTTPNALPAVQLNSPVNLLTITDCSSITLSATASDSDGSVTNVSFFVNGLLLGSLAQPPYTITVDGLPFATNNLTAVATDDLGGRSTSNVRTVFTQLLPLHNLKASLAPGNRLRLCFRGLPGTNYVFEASSSLVTPILWQPFATNVAPGAIEGLITLTDAQAATSKHKFYRARQAP